MGSATVEPTLQNIKPPMTLKDQIAAYALPPGVRERLEEICRDIEASQQKTDEQFMEPIVDILCHVGHINLAINCINLHRQQSEEFATWEDTALEYFQHEMNPQFRENVEYSWTLYKGTVLTTDGRANRNGLVYTLMKEKEWLLRKVKEGFNEMKVKLALRTSEIIDDVQLILNDVTRVQKADVMGFYHFPNRDRSELKLLVPAAENKEFAGMMSYDMLSIYVHCICIVHERECRVPAYPWFWDGRLSGLGEAKR